MKKSILFLMIIAALASCNNKQKPITNEEKANFVALGDSISAAAQKLLLQNVSSAIQQGGTDYAVDFCNTNAMNLTDSAANEFKVFISRLSDRNRNTNNAITTEIDSLAWQKIKSEKASFVEETSSGEIYFYKPISIAMPTCIKCHGSELDIAESTQKVIKEKYPNDKAVGYKLGDLRGMWKIKMSKT